MLGAVYAGLINWIVTTIIVEGTVFQDARDALDRLPIPPKYKELWHCHLCTGTWVGFGLAMFLGGPLATGLSPILDVLLNGFLYKAVGHVILEVTGLVKNYNRRMDDDNFRRTIRGNEHSRRTVQTVQSPDSVGDRLTDVVRVVR